MTSRHPAESEMLAACVRVPESVVYRDFVNETVVLNLETGRYHGLNPTAGRMLAELEQTDTVRSAAHNLAREYGVAEDRMEGDVVSFCRDLLNRGLIELDD
jgi:Coenzyme PQQ synthesis protein D (PqqD)